MAGLAKSGDCAAELAPSVCCADDVGVPPFAIAAEERAGGGGMVWSANAKVAGGAVGFVWQ